MISLHHHLFQCSHPVFLINQYWVPQYTLVIFMIFSKVRGCVPWALIRIPEWVWWFVIINFLPSMFQHWSWVSGGEHLALVSFRWMLLESVTAYLVCWNGINLKPCIKVRVLAHIPATTILVSIIRWFQWWFHGCFPTWTWLEWWYLLLILLLFCYLVIILSWESDIIPSIICWLECLTLSKSTIPIWFRISVIILIPAIDHG